MSCSASGRVGSVGHDAGLRSDGARGGHLGHSIEMLLHLSNLLDTTDIRGLLQAAEHLLDSNAVFHPLLNEGLGSRLLGLLGRHNLLGRLAAGGLGALTLPLAALRLTNLGSGRRGRGVGAAGIVVYTLHMVLEVPLAREAISGNVTLAVLIGAAERAFAVSVEAMSLTLVAEEASRGREAGTLTGLSLAAVRLQVRVDELAVYVG